MTERMVTMTVLIWCRYLPFLWHRTIFCRNENIWLISHPTIFCSCLCWVDEIAAGVWELWFDTLTTITGAYLRENYMKNPGLLIKCLYNPLHDAYIDKAKYLGCTYNTNMLQNSYFLKAQFRDYIIITILPRQWIHQPIAQMRFSLGSTTDRLISPQNIFPALFKFLVA